MSKIVACAPMGVVAVEAGMDRFADICIPRK